MKFKEHPEPGTCCACGEAGDEESYCTSIPDGTHCNHFYRGPETECLIDDGQDRTKPGKGDK